METDLSDALFPRKEKFQSSKLVMAPLVFEKRTFAELGPVPHTTLVPIPDSGQRMFWGCSLQVRCRLNAWWYGMGRFVIGRIARSREPFGKDWLAPKPVGKDRFRAVFGADSGRHSEQFFGADSGWLAPTACSPRASASRPKRHPFSSSSHQSNARR